MLLAGDNLGLFVVNPLTARTEQRSMPSSAWLLPNLDFWNDEVIVTGPKGNYTARDYKRFFDDIEFPDGYMMRQDTEKLTYALKPPGVEVHCLHGKGVDTPGTLHYSVKQWYDNQPDVVFDDGDGTVNMRSLLGCLRWQGKMGKHQVFHQTFTGRMAAHIQILDNDQLKAYIKTILLS